MWTTEKIADEVRREKIVIFAKGTKAAPRCGFSARAIEVMGRFNKPFNVVDVLADPSLRPALVQFSSWPTTPQVYLDGELIGGSDIIQEMFDAGDLQKKVADVFKEEYKEIEDDCPVEVTSTALSKLEEFIEGSNDKLRLNVGIKNGERVYELEIDTQSHPSEDTKYKVGSITVVHKNSIRPLFDKLTVDWVKTGDNEGFAVKESGNPKPLPVPLDINKAELKGLLDNTAQVSPGKFWLVDVREQDEWNSGHAKDAVFLPLSDIEKKWESVGFNKEDTIVMYCKRGGRSTQAAQFFRQKLGFEKVRSLIGGVSEVPQEIVT